MGMKRIIFLLLAVLLVSVVACSQPGTLNKEQSYKLEIIKEVQAFEKGLEGAGEYPQIYVDYADFLDRQKKTPDRAMRLLEKYLTAVPNPNDKIRVDLIMSRLKTKVHR